MQQFYTQTYTMADADQPIWSHKLSIGGGKCSEQARQRSQSKTNRSHVSFDERFVVLEPGDVRRRIACCWTAQRQRVTRRWRYDRRQLLAHPPRTFNATDASHWSASYGRCQDFWCSGSMRSKTEGLEAKESRYCWTFKSEQTKIRMTKESNESETYMQHAPLPVYLITTLPLDLLSWVMFVP